MSDRDQRTEQPTPRRREEARREGRVAKSRDLSVAVSLVGGFLMLREWGPVVAERTLAAVHRLLGQVAAAPEILEGEGLKQVATGLTLYLAHCCLPLALVGGSIMILSHSGQGAWLFVPRSVAPRLDRLRPLEGMRRLVSLSSCLRGVFAGAKLFVVGACLWGVLVSEEIGAVARAAGWRALWSELTGFGLDLSLWLLLLACADYAVQRWLHERSLRMTREEVREEAQSQEGDQTMKNRRRRFLVASECSARSTEENREEAPCPPWPGSRRSRS